MHLLDVLSWVMSGVAIIGNIFNTKKNKFGFVFWSVSNLFMVFRFWHTKQFDQCALNSIYFFLSIYGLYSWNKTSKNNNVSAES
ncbi:MAG: nicotinamide mononucleotide transporter [Candidatus Improbicoccus devescovinae]|nr:MAG: nicotinamide mononucleotide transporter [Candidatus Improbicoccus devescovinae]